MLGYRAYKCRCGWKEQAVSERSVSFVDCAHFGCDSAAKVNVKTATGFANLCMAHYDAHHLERAKSVLAGLGIETKDEQKSFWRNQVEILRGGNTNYRGWQRQPKSEKAREFIDEIRAQKPVRDRVPGEDDEPLEVEA